MPPSPHAVKGCGHLTRQPGSLIAAFEELLGLLEDKHVTALLCVNPRCFNAFHQLYMGHGLSTKSDYFKVISGKQPIVFILRLDVDRTRFRGVLTAMNVESNRRVTHIPNKPAQRHASAR
jgi:hypothetical protein